MVAKEAITMKTVQYWIDKLELLPHPEGGYYRQTDLSETKYENTELPLFTTIYFLLSADNSSHFHQLTSDELWFFHDGEPLTVHELHPDGSYTFTELGKEKFHYTVKAGSIFGSTVKQGYALVSCAVVPGFDFSNFKLFTQSDLLESHPDHKTIIKELAFKELPEE